MPFGACHSVGMVHAIDLAWRDILGLKTGKTWVDTHAYMCARGKGHPIASSIKSHGSWNVFGAYVGAFSSEHRVRGINKYILSSA